MITSRPILQNLTRRFKVIASLTEDSPIFYPRKCNLYRYFTSGAATSDLEDDMVVVENDDLKSRIFRLRLPKRSATNALQKWIGEGNRISLSELRQISIDLIQSRRFKHALEVSEWMVSHDEFELSTSDYAVRIDLMAKVFNIHAAERYFENLPPEAKTIETCTALIHSYAAIKMVENAENLYERMKGSEMPLTLMVFNVMMTMYVSVGEVEKVSLVVEELKRRNVSPDLYTYNSWISSCASTLKIDEVMRILDKMRSDPSCDENWTRYIDLAKIYITAGNLVNSESNSVVSATKKGITQREWITYDFLIILQTGLRDKEKIDQIWKSLKMTGQKMTCRNYICVMSSYLMLGHLKEVNEVIDQWKESMVTAFDASACKRILHAFADIGFTEKAKDLHLLLARKNSDRKDSPT